MGLTELCSLNPQTPIGWSPTSGRMVGECLGLPGQVWNMSVFALLSYIFQAIRKTFFYHDQMSATSLSKSSTVKPPLGTVRFSASFTCKTEFAAQLAHAGGASITACCGSWDYLTVPNYIMKFGPHTLYTWARETGTICPFPVL